MTHCFPPNYVNGQGFYSPCEPDPSRQSDTIELAICGFIFILCCCCCCAAGDTKVETIANCCSPCVLIGKCCEMLTNLCKSLGETVCNTFGRESEPLPIIVADLVLPTLPGPLQMQPPVVGVPLQMPASEGDVPQDV